LLNQTGPLESNFTSVGYGNNPSNFVSNDKYNVPLESFNHTQELNTIKNLQKNDSYEVKETVVNQETQVKEEPKIELYQLIQNNKLTHKTENDQDRESERVISKNNQTTSYYNKPRQQTYTMNNTVMDSAFTERLTHDPTAVPVNRRNVLGGLKSKPVKRSFTNGLRIFRKVKDAQGNIIKENLEQSINIYSNKILNTLQKKKYETADALGHTRTGSEVKSNVRTYEKVEEIPTRNYKTHLYTSSTINTPIANRGLTSDRVISSLNEKNKSSNLLYSSTRNIDDNQFTYSQPKRTNDNQLTTSIFYSGTKTENNSARNSKLKTNYVRSTRVSPAITIGSRSQGIYRKCHSKRNLIDRSA